MARELLRVEVEEPMQVLEEAAAGVVGQGLMVLGMVLGPVAAQALAR